MRNRAHRVGLALSLSVAVAVVAGARGADQTSIEGAHDGSEGIGANLACQAHGWAVDPDWPTLDVTVRVLADGVEVATAVASEFRQDLADLGIGGDGTAAFTVDLGTLLPSGREHEIRVEAQDLDSGAWEELADTGRLLTCTGLSGFHDVQSGVVTHPAECFAAGWAFDADRPGRRVSVRIRVDGIVVAETEADEFRPDVRDAGFGDGYSGWTVQLFGKHVKPFVEHVIAAEARDRESRQWLPLGNTWKQVTCLPASGGE